MAMVWIEIGVLLLLVLINGLFSMSELAIVASRKTRLKQQAAEGHRGSAIALDFVENPDRFLPTVQIGITLVGVFTGAFGGVTLAAILDDWLERFDPIAPYSEIIAISFVVLTITYVTLVLGELVPKRIALSRPEHIAALVSGPLLTLSRMTRPVVKLLGGSTEFIVRLLGIHAHAEPPVTEEEVAALIKQGAETGVFEASEHDIVRRVFRLGDRCAGELMTPRPEVIWIDVADPPAEIQSKIAASPHSRFPVCEGSLDHVLGIVQVKDLLVQGFRGHDFDLRGILIMPLFLYEGTPGFRVLELFKSTGIHTGIVLDEYGSVEGIVTMNDILEALVGVLPGEGEAEEPMVVTRQDGSWLVDGRTPLDELAEQLQLPNFPEGDYHTIAGFLIDQLGRIPSTSDTVAWSGFSYEVVDMDHHRIDKVLISPAASGRPG